MRYDSAIAPETGTRRASIRTHAFGARYVELAPNHFKISGVDSTAIGGAARSTEAAGGGGAGESWSVLDSGLLEPLEKVTVDVEQRFAKERTRGFVW